MVFPTLLPNIYFETWHKKKVKEGFDSVLLRKKPLEWNKFLHQLRLVHLTPRFMFNLTQSLQLQSGRIIASDAIL